MYMWRVGICTCGGWWAYFQETKNFLSCCTSVRPSDQIKLSVSKVTCEQYNKMHSDLDDIRRVGECSCSNAWCVNRPEVHYYCGKTQSSVKVSRIWGHLQRDKTMNIIVLTGLHVWYMLFHFHCYKKIWSNKRTVLRLVHVHF